MKKILLHIMLVNLLLSCDSSDAPSCLKMSGETIQQTIELPDFSSFEINQEFTIILEEAPEQHVSIVAGENLVSEISLDVIDSHLIITNRNSCNWVRDYDFPVIHITHPDITRIKQNGGGSVTSIGMLSYPDLTLVSEKSTGNFTLSLNVDKLSISNNDVSNFYLTGSAGQLQLGFYSGDGRFEGQNLLVQNAEVFHRGSNDIIVNVSESLTGQLLSTGDLIYVGSKPATIDLSIENRGRVIDNSN